MDGVLIDVSRSYRKAIQETAEYFLGEKIIEDEIQELKNKGGFNSDWDLTEALIAAKGVRVTREKIIDKFQSFYIGNNYDGFIENEEPLIDKKILNELSSRYLLGIVTGRPRAEAEFVLKKYGLNEYFQVIIAMEDVKRQKPDPSGIKRALKKLNNGHAYYIGDTVDDMQAANRARVIPVEIISVNSKKERQRRLLEENGAYRVLENVNEISGILHEEKSIS